MALADWIPANLRGTVQSLFRLGKASDPTSVQWKNNTGVVEARNFDDTAFSIGRGLDPVGDDDWVTKRFLTLSGGAVRLGRVAIVDQINGNDASGTVGGAPYLTIGGALTDCASGDCVWVMPGTYSESITIPAGVSVEGIDAQRCIISRTGVVGATDLVTMGTTSRLQGFSLILTSASDVTLRGIVFPSTTSASARVIDCSLAVTSTAAGASTTTGIHSFGTGVPASGFYALTDVEVTVTGAGTGAKRALLVDTAAHSFRAQDCSLLISGAGTTLYGAETNFAGVTLTLRGGLASGTTADISQTLGTLAVGEVELANNSANALGFTVLHDSFVLSFGDPGSLPTSVTRYLYQGTATVTSTEIFYRLGSPRVLRSLGLRAVTGPGALRVMTITVRKNGVNTTMTTTLTGAATSALLTTVSVPFSATDDLSVQIVTVTGDATSDLTAALEFY